MRVKIENKSTCKIDFDKVSRHIDSVVEIVPTAHLRGISKIILVDRIEEARLNPSQRSELPGLYHPKLPGYSPWLEIALVTLRNDTSWYKRLARRLAFKRILTTVLLSLIAQHYFLTLTHGVKKPQVDSNIRSYVEKQLSVYGKSRKGIIAQMLRPVRPLLERFARWLRKRYLDESTRKNKVDSRSLKRRGIIRSNFFDRGPN